MIDIDKQIISEIKSLESKNKVNETKSPKDYHKMLSILVKIESYH